jgi:hypothetical protein
MSVSAVGDLVGRTKSRIEDIKESAENQSLPDDVVEKAVEHVTKGAKATADSYREGDVLQKNLATTVDDKTRESAAHFEMPTPEFHKVARGMADKLGRLLADDNLSTKLKEIEGAIQYISSEDDRNALERIEYQLHELVKRTQAWHSKMLVKNVGTKVVPLVAIEGGK